MYRKVFTDEELNPFKKKFFVCFEQGDPERDPKTGLFTGNIIVIDKEHTTIKIFGYNESVICNCKNVQFNISKRASSLWREGLYRTATIFDVQNALTKVQLNGEPITYENVEKYL